VEYIELCDNFKKYGQLNAYLVNEVTDEQRYAATRQLCKTDLYFLLRYILGRKDVENAWYFARCREVQKDPDGFIDLWAREHGKSTIITYAKTIQDILNNPEITIGIFSHTRPISKAFLRQIKREFELNELLKTLFPDILYKNPASESPSWSEDGGITVIRKGNPKEATVEAWGLVDGQPTGRHFKLRIYDDVVTRENVTTPEQIKKTTEAFELSDNLGSIGGSVRIIGTRYHLSDTYASILSRNIATPRIYPATHNGRFDGLPVLFTNQEWERRKRTQSRKILSAQLLQNPLADEDARFQPLWLTAYEVRPSILNIAIMGDPSLGRHAKSDRTAIVVLGYAKGGVKYLLDGCCHRMSLSQRWTALKQLYVKWDKEPGVQSISVGWERYGLQADKEYFEERMRVDKDKVIFNIEELNWVRDGEQSKESRIERLEPDFRNRRLLLPLACWHDGQPKTWKVDSDSESKTYQSVQYQEFEGLTKLQTKMLESGQEDMIARAIKKVDNERQIYDLSITLIEEFLQFPFGGFDDLLDATSRFYDLDMVEPMGSSDKASLNPPVYADS
jgi:hypothetical protein